MTCRYAGPESPRLLPTGDACPEMHCTAREHCGAHIGPTELTCPGCIRKTREDLTMIVALDALMLPEAIERGVESEAAYLAGPVADPESLMWRNLAALAAIQHLEDAEWISARALLPDDDPHHPRLVLGRWEMMLREEWGPETTERLTTESAAEYLDTRLFRLANSRDQDFPLFRREVAACRIHLEAVLHDSRAPEKGAPCPACTKDGEKGPALSKTYVDSDKTGASDYWGCGKCKATWKEADYRQRIGVRYLEHADRLTASQIRQTYRVAEGSVRGWASLGKVRKHGRDHQGLTLYDVDDVLAVRDAVVVVP